VTPGEIRVTGGLSISPTWLQALADVFQAETVPVLGEGAAVGAAIHAAWVWLKEQREERSLADLAAPFVLLDEAGRHRPNPVHQPAYDLLRRLYRALSARVRGAEGEDPFKLRKELLGVSGASDGPRPG
jgi:xylulokinase